MSTVEQPEQLEQSEPPMAPSQKTIYLKDYQAPFYWVESLDLIFDLHEDKTIVRSVLRCNRNAAYPETQNLPLKLLGEELMLLELRLDSRALSKSEYQLDEEGLTLQTVPQSFILEIKTEIHPERNTELSGLYRSNALFCTQCESQGFRRITFYPDRPDVMAKFTTTIYADKRRYPVLLSNGNCVERGDLDEHRHWVKWEDPFLKPCYLFALVAGNLVSLEDYFVTQSGRLITLRIYIEPHNQDKCAHAMEALKKAMAWDEATYGREYDLDIYMIVAVNDFNFGAMENKGLNIFNAKYILARPETATDFDYQHIDDVVGHEYFHNWSGNRVTCRDWFQLSLKEGFTVFREHHFSRDVSKSPVSLIENVRYLRTGQFSEDAGPMAHSVRPESYIEITNFYTSTIYEKGSQVIRMLQTLLGWERFRQGTDLYFERYDGQAVTTDDFICAMETVSGQDLTQFKLWYSQAGTPEITVEEAYDAPTSTYQLSLKQFCPPTPGQAEKKPMVIPVAMGLLQKEGVPQKDDTQILILKEAEQSFSFPNVKKRPVASLFRGFSAPVHVRFERKDEELAFLLAEDTDPFNRWDAGQKLTERLIWDLVEAQASQKPLQLSEIWREAHQQVLQDPDLNPALKTEILSLPALSYLIEQKKDLDFDALVKARRFLKESLAQAFSPLLLKEYEAHTMLGKYQYTPEAVAARSFKNLCLSYLMLGKNKEALKVCLSQWKMADNMTDSIAVLNALSNWEGPERQSILTEFYEKWQHDPLVMDKWFRVQALSELPNTLAVVQELVKHPAFDIKNPNRVYSLIGAFCTGNLVAFHEKSGGAYRFLSECVLTLDAQNPQVASRMVRAFANWKRFDTERQVKIQKELQGLLDHKLSKDVFEIVSKSLVPT